VAVRAVPRRPPAASPARRTPILVRRAPADVVTARRGRSDTTTGLLSSLADELARAERIREPVAPLTERYPGLSVEDAYGVQQFNVERRVAAGERIVGRKVGLTSVAMQRQLGVDEPDFGALLEEMVLPDGGTLRLDELVAPRIEAEIAFRLGHDLTGAEVDLAAARAAVVEVMLALEVIDSRVADWRIGLVDTIADNASSARVVTGPPTSASPGLLASLADEVLVVTEDGTEVATGRGEAVLGDPLEAVAWLARRLGGLGGGLRAGDLVLAGAVHASLPLRPCASLRVTSSRLAPVAIAVR
jgi:2-keto-4-pentenoate hydratase